jgi:hypothetical protein
MPQRTRYAHGTPSWTDLATTDLAASKLFYCSLFGWDTSDEDSGDPDAPYVIAMQGGKTVAGMMRLSPDMQAGGMPPVWSMYVTVDDVDAATTKVRELGGGVLSEPMDVMTAGRMAMCADPTGAVFCLWQARDSIGAEVVNEPNSLVWEQLVTPDVDVSKSFYGGLFGWTSETMQLEDRPPYTVWTIEGQENAMGGATPPLMPGMPPSWGIYFAVADCDATVAQAKDLGATEMVEPNDVPGVGRSATLVDPQGAAFTVMAMANEQR